MTELDNLMHEYAQIAMEVRRLADRKEVLRAQIRNHLDREGIVGAKTPFGTAQRRTVFKLNPKREAVLALLAPEDILAFARFTPARVREELVPKYGREVLLPLFEIERSEQLVISAKTRGG